MHSKVWHNKNLCDLRLTHIIRINKSHTEICRFTVTQSAGADPEIFRGGWLSGWLPVLYYIKTWGAGWLASNDRPIPIVSCTNKQVKGGWLATPSTTLPGSALIWHDYLATAESHLSATWWVLADMCLNTTAYTYRPATTYTCTCKSSLVPRPCPRKRENVLVLASSAVLFSGSYLSQSECSFTVFMWYCIWSHS